jgi:DMSO/TMAO reductase YedYZ molybdopterin-dependent catalytic subunit
MDGGGSVVRRTQFVIRLNRGLEAILRQRLPAPPETLRRGPWRRHAFRSRLRSPWLTARLGAALGIAFGICFVTGLLSELIQHPPAWFGWPARPVGLYRVTQGLHVATGIGAIGLLSAKLWSVYPKLFTWPPARDVRHALERISVLALIGAALFQLTTGVLNIASWYSLMPFGFISAHYWVAWLAIGALLLHVAVKLPVIAGALTRTRTRTRAPASGPVAGGMSRRGVLAAVGATVGALTLATAGQTVRPLSRVSVLAPRRPDIGPQGLPVNTSAVAAGVTEVIHDPGYRLTLRGPSGARELTLADLGGLPQTTVELPVACVEGWSATGLWSGVRIADLMALVGGAPGASVTVESLQRGGSASTSALDAAHAADPLTLLALRLNGEPLHPDHGYPARLIAPNRPGVMQTKWVAVIRVVGP